MGWHSSGRGFPVSRVTKIVTPVSGPSSPVTEEVLAGVPNRLRFVGFEEGGPFSEQDTSGHLFNPGVNSAEVEVNVETEHGTFLLFEETIPAGDNTSFGSFALAENDRLLVSLKSADAIVTAFINAADINDEHVKRTSLKIEEDDGWVDVLAPENGVMYVPLGQEEVQVAAIGVDKDGAEIEARLMGPNGEIFNMQSLTYPPTPQAIINADLEEFVYAVKPLPGWKYQVRVVDEGPVYMYVPYIVAGVR